MISERRNVVLRVMDRWAGIPLVAILGALRRLRWRQRPATVRRVGVLKTAAIGDTVLMSAIVRDLLAAGVEVVIFAGTQNADAARLIEGVSEVVVLPMASPVRAAMRIRSRPVDLLLDFGSWPRVDAALAAVARARWTAGFRTKGQWRHMAYDEVVDHSAASHEIENYRRLASALGFQTGAEPALRDGDAVPAALAPGRPYVTCHMWSGGYRGKHKQWALERWAAVVSHLLREGYHVALTGGAETAGATAAFVAKIQGHEGRLHNLAGRLTLSETLELLRDSALVLSVNTGVMHMAAVTGVPVLSIEGPVPVRRWGPVGADVHSVVSPHPGAGYLNLGWEYGKAPPDTMASITIDMVSGVANAMLAGRRR